MWQKLKNIFSSVETYSELSPDLALRSQVNQSLKSRPCLCQTDWIVQFWRPRKVSEKLAAFVYAHFAEYSGLEWGRVLPSDRLETDLHFSLVCWFDWELTLCEDFYQNFGIDLSDRLDEIISATTLEDLMLSLQSQLQSAHSV